MEADRLRFEMQGKQAQANELESAIAVLKTSIQHNLESAQRIRADLEAACRQSGDRLFLPELKYCGDNAAMIGCQGYYEFLAGRTAGLDLNAYASRDISLG